MKYTKTKDGRVRTINKITDKEVREIDEEEKRDFISIICIVADEFNIQDLP